MTRRRPPKSLSERELLASMTGQIVQPEEEPEVDRLVGWPEVTFAVGALLAAAGLAMWWLPAALVFLGGLLVLIAWRRPGAAQQGRWGARSPTMTPWPRSCARMHRSREKRTH